MIKSLLFIPDISGFTYFVQNTEIQHSQKIIENILELLITTNELDLKLAEIEGDALFFYQDGKLPSQERLLSQIKAMQVAFYNHLKNLSTHDICPCKACDEALKLQLKIIVHYGVIDFLDIQGNKKPFGQPVIEVHWLLKNSIPSHNYALLTKDLVNAIGMDWEFENDYFRFYESKDVYDNKALNYIYSEASIQ